MRIAQRGFAGRPAIAAVEGHACSGENAGRARLVNFGNLLALVLADVQRAGPVERHTERLHQLESWGHWLNGGGLRTSARECREPQNAKSLHRF